MADNESQIQAIGRVYAQALINEAQKQDALAEVTEDVRGIGELYRSNEAFRAFTQALAIGEDERTKSLEKIFSGRIHVLTLNVLKAMARRDRFMFLPGFVEGLAAILRKMGNIVDAYVVSAVELPPQAAQRIKDALGKSLGKTVEVHVKVDPALLGGVTLTIDDTLIDGSVATQLQKLKEQLKRGGRFRPEAVVA